MKLRGKITKALPEISNVMRLPSETNRVGTEHVHPTCPPKDAMGCFKSRVPLAQNKHRLVLVVLRISGYWLIAFNQVRTNEVDLVRDPQTCGYQEDPERERTEVHDGASTIPDTCDSFISGSEWNNTPACVIRCVLISQDVAPASGGLHSPYLSNIHTIPNVKPKLLLKHGQIDREGISLRVKLSAHSLKQQIRIIAQERIPIMAQVELLVLSACVYLVNADELPVPRVPGHTKQKQGGISQVVQQNR